MSDNAQIITAGGIITGVIIVAVTGLVWPLAPIAAAILCGRAAAQAMEEKPANDPPKKETKKK